jgi:hypothetical protein
MMAVMNSGIAFALQMANVAATAYQQLQQLHGCRQCSCQVAAVKACLLKIRRHLLAF